MTAYTAKDFAVCGSILIDLKCLVSKCYHPVLDRSIDWCIEVSKGRVFPDPNFFEMLEVGNKYLMANNVKNAFEYYHSLATHCAQFSK